MKARFFLAALGCAAFLASPALADSPKKFLEDALHGDNSEIMLGQVAEHRADSRAVRNYGSTLVRDHTKARAEVLQVGRPFGLRSDRDTMPEAAEERDKLQALHGREFDREFVRYMVVDHQKDISDFRDETHEGHGAVTSLARRQLPTLEKHLRIARDLSERS